jgi:hypothetical protein
MKTHYSGMKIGLSVFSLTALLLAGCYVDNAEDLYNCSVNPSAVTYTNTIAPILTANGCTGCHSGSRPDGGHNLTIYSGVKTVADNGRLWGAVNHLEGFKPMPQGGGKISACDIKRLKAWMDAGAPNN